MDAPGEIKDSIIAASARYAEHYEMAGYLSTIDIARELNQDKIRFLLLETLSEERVTEKNLPISSKRIL